MTQKTRRREDGETRRHGEAETRRRRDTETPRVPTSPRLCVSMFPRHVAISPRPRVPPSPHLLVVLAVALVSLLLASSVAAQRKRSITKDSHTTSKPEVMSPAARELVEAAIGVICLERKKDPKGSVPIDDMQGRPSLPIYTPEAVAGAERARRLLPIARELVEDALRQLSSEYKLNRTSAHKLNMQRAIARLRMVKRVKPDVDSRDNASVFLRRPHTITFGTIFLAGLPSDEGMISVLAHELVHIADGERDSLRMLFQTVGRRASGLTGLKIYEQRAEELTSDLIGAMAARTFVTRNPDYEPLARRIARAVAHNCVEQDEGDEDHLSPRDTIRALLALRPQMASELVYGPPPPPMRPRN